MREEHGGLTRHQVGSGDSCGIGRDHRVNGSRIERGHVELIGLTWRQMGGARRSHAASIGIRGSMNQGLRGVMWD
eukprot:756079-Pelagomonas_calceolata.AAC.4